LVSIKVLSVKLSAGLLLGLTIAASGAGHAEEKPVALYKGLGAWRHPISTQNSDAQKFFDQGLTLVYGFKIAQGPYINMDGDPSYNLQAACGAVQAACGFQACQSLKEPIFKRHLRGVRSSGLTHTSKQCGVWR
jgi:hypothetical protein